MHLYKNFLRTTRRVVEDPLFGTHDVAGIKSATGAAKQGVNQANTTAGNYGTQASSVGATLVPFEEKQLTNPTGINPTDKNNMLVAAQQGAGGATGSLSEEATQRAARTHNTGALSGVLDEIARAKTKSLSNANLGVENENTKVKLGQQAEAAKALGGERALDVNAQLKAEGLVPEDIDAWAKANQTGWVQNVDNTIASISGASKGPAAYI